jgi:hypothetical protein
VSTDPTPVPPEATRYARHVQVLWRLGPDRVLVRRPWPTEGQDEAADFLGLAAMIWLVLDEPGTLGEIELRLAEAADADDPSPANDDLVDTVDRLVATGWVERTAT